MNGVVGEGEPGETTQRSFGEQPLVSRLGPCSKSPQVLMSPRSCQAAPLFVFHSNVGTDLDKGDSGVYFLHLEAWNGGEGNSRLVLPASWKR